MKIVDLEIAVIEDKDGNFSRNERYPKYFWVVQDKLTQNTFQSEQFNLYGECIINLIVFQNKYIFI